MATEHLPDVILMDIRLPGHGRNGGRAPDSRTTRGTAGDPGRRPDVVCDEGRPRAAPRCRLRRLPREADQRQGSFPSRCDAFAAWRGRNEGPRSGPRLGQGVQLAAELLDLVAKLGRVLEPELLGGREHLLLERDHELLQLLARHALDLALATPTARRHGRGLEREELGDVGDALHDRLGRDPVLLVVGELHLAPPRRSPRARPGSPRSACRRTAAPCR